MFTEPARLLARLHAANGAPTYLYLILGALEDRAEGVHGGAARIDRQYVFNTLAPRPGRPAPRMRAPRAHQRLLGRLRPPR